MCDLIRLLTHNHIQGSIRNCTSHSQLCSPIHGLCMNGQFINATLFENKRTIGERYLINSRRCHENQYHRRKMDVLNIRFEFDQNGSFVKVSVKDFIQVKKLKKCSRWQLRTRVISGSQLLRLIWLTSFHQYIFAIELLRCFR